MAGGRGIKIGQRMLKNSQNKPINGIQTLLNIDEKGLDSRAFKETSAKL